MKLSLIVSAIVIGLSFGSVIGIASAGAPVTTTSQESPFQKEVGFNLELPKDPVTVISTQVIYGSAPKKVHGSLRSTKEKTLTCGAFYDNLVGGQTRNCEWQ